MKPAAASPPQACRPRARTRLLSAVCSIAVGFAGVSPGLAAPVDTVAPPLDAKTFQDPPRTVRPLYRWWLPLAATEKRELERELDEMAQAGAGGVEVVGLPVAGSVGASNVFLSRYGFGTPRWSARLTDIYRHAARRGLRVDVTASASWPTTSPNVFRLNDPAAQQQLVYGAVQVQPGAAWTAPPPEPATPGARFSGTLCADAPAQGRRLRLANVGPYSIGDVVSVGEGQAAEQAKIVAIAPAAGAVCTVLAAEAPAGSDRVRLSEAPNNLTPGVKVRIGQGSTSQVVTITSVLPQGKAAEAVFTPALSAAQAAGSPLATARAGSLTLEAALSRAHRAGAPVVNPAKRTLVALVAVQCASDICPASGGRRQVDPATTVMLTDQISPDGRLTWQAPAGGRPWWLAAFYQSADGQALNRLSASQPNYVIDHLGPAGARALADFHDRAVFTPALRGLMRQSQGALFEDSFEPSSGLKWTWGFLEAFKARRGYDLAPLLPVLAGGGVGAQRGVFDFPGDLGDRVREDYRQTWSDLYGDNHLRPYNSWAHGLGLSTRIQVEGGPMQIADLATLPDLPEGENRNFLNDPELWKVIGIGAILRQTEAPLSTECCPIAGGVWATTAGGAPYAVAQGTGARFGGAGNDANLNWIYKAYAGGVSQLIWHGYPYAYAPKGAGEAERWPGNTFENNTSFSEAFGSRMPQWADYQAVNDHLARLQLVLRQGQPRYDVAVFWHDHGVRGLAPTVTAFTGYPGLSKMVSTTSDLAKAGYTWQYLGPKQLASAAPSEVRNGVLFPDKIGLRALVLNEQQVIPAESLARIRDLALTEELPLIIVGTPPVRASGAPDRQVADTRIKALVEELRAAAARPGAKVWFVAGPQDLPGALAHAGVEPAAGHLSDPTSDAILSVRRATPDVDYYFLFNQGLTPVRQTLRLTGQGSPFELNSWTGQARPLGLFEPVEGGVKVPVSIGANDVKVIAVGRTVAGMPAPAVHALGVGPEDIRLEAGALILRASAAGEVETRLSTGVSARMSVAAVPALTRLETWTLEIESWTPDQSGLPGPAHTLKTRLAPRTVQADPATGALPSWTALGSPDVAGVGRYTATVKLPADWRPGDGAYLDLGRVVDTFQISVNGERLAPSSFQDTAGIDLGQRLRPGRNLIEVRVATPLRNAVEAATGAGAKKLTTYGLLGPVILRPYRSVVIAPSQ